MKKDQVIELLRDYNRTENIDEILNLDERILDILVDADNCFGIILDIAKKEPNIDVCLEKLEIIKSLNKKGCVSARINYAIFSIEELKLLNEIEPRKVKYTAKILLSKELKEAGLTEEAIETLKTAKNVFNVEYASEILLDTHCINSGIALEGQKVINDSKNEFNAFYASEVLLDEDCIEEGIALQAAKTINESPYEFNAFYASLVLRDTIYIKRGVALELAKLINSAKTKDIAEGIWLLTIVNHNQSEIINEAKKLLDARNLQVDDEEIFDTDVPNENIGFADELINFIKSFKEKKEVSTLERKKQP